MKNNGLLQKNDAKILLTLLSLPNKCVYARLLSKKLHMAVSGCTNSIASLQDKRLVVYTKSQEKRIKCMKLTSKGKKVAKEVLKLWNLCETLAD